MKFKKSKTKKKQLLIIINKFVKNIYFNIF